ncbi:MAG TPA: FAD-dependent oxidoreductase [Stellaceae bacterium]|nr:FAD-dependent oxidoreductase [Stellaceae bacterium]
MADGADFDVVIVGAGAAGIAACRRLAAARLRVIALEARHRLGGRAWTVPTAIDKPVDLGCEWLHSADINPWSGIAGALGFALDKTPPDWTSRIAIHDGEAANEDWQRARDAFEEAYERAARLSYDQPASALLPPGGRWNKLFDAISTWANGAELDKVSVKDRQNYNNTGLNWRCYDGYGALINAYAEGLPIRRETVVERVDHSGRHIRIVTDRGELTANAVIVTLSTNLLAAEAIRFTPALPRIVDAAAGLPCGVANKLFLALDGPTPAESYLHLIGRTDRTETGNYQLRPHGWPMISCYFGGMLSVRLEKAGPAAMAAFAIDELAGIFGNDIRSRLHPLASSAWGTDPFARGSYSCALPGHVDNRTVLATPVDDRLFFVGEACSRDQFGTAHAAFATAIAAADKIVQTTAPAALPIAAAP